VELGDQLHQLLLVLWVGVLLEVAIDEILGVLEDRWIDLVVEEFLPDELVELLVGFVLLVLILDEVNSVGRLHLHDLPRQLLSQQFGQRPDNHVELLIEGGDVESLDLEGEVVETQLGLLEEGDLLLLCLALAAVEEDEDDAAEEVNCDDDVKEILALDLVET
jgi:hypothetical protein